MNISSSSNKTTFPDYADPEATPRPQPAPHTDSTTPRQAGPITDSTTPLHEPGQYPDSNTPRSGTEPYPDSPTLRSETGPHDNSTTHRSGAEPHAESTTPHFEARKQDDSVIPRTLAGWRRPNFRLELLSNELKSQVVSYLSDNIEDLEALASVSLSYKTAVDRFVTHRLKVLLRISYQRILSSPLLPQLVDLDSLTPNRRNMTRRLQVKADSKQELALTPEDNTALAEILCLFPRLRSFSLSDLASTTVHPSVANALWDLPELKYVRIEASNNAAVLSFVGAMGVKCLNEVYVNIEAFRNQHESPLGIGSDQRADTFEPHTPEEGNQANVRHLTLVDDMDQEDPTPTFELVTGLFSKIVGLESLFYVGPVLSPAVFGYSTRCSLRCLSATELDLEALSQVDFPGLQVVMILDQSMERCADLSTPLFKRVEAVVAPPNVEGDLQFHLVIGIPRHLNIQFLVLPSFESAETCTLVPDQRDPWNLEVLRSLGRSSLTSRHPRKSFFDAEILREGEERWAMVETMWAETGKLWEVLDYHAVDMLHLLDTGKVRKFSGNDNFITWPPDDKPA